MTYAKETGLVWQKHALSAIERNRIIVWDLICPCFHLTWTFYHWNIRPQLSQLTTNLLLGPKRCKSCPKCPRTLLFLTFVNCIVHAEHYQNAVLLSTKHSVVDLSPILSWGKRFPCNVIVKSDVLSALRLLWEISAADLSTGTAPLVSITKSDGPVSPK